jgi:hypothetical protein
MLASVMITLPRSTIVQLLGHATAAARLVGHLDDKAQPELIRQIGEHADTIAHELAELLGAPDAVARDGAPRLKAIMGGGS